MTIYSKISVFCMMLILPLTVQAKESAWSSSTYAQGKLISTLDAVGDEEAIEGIFHLRLKEDWHTYWRTSGDSGLPPKFDWSGSKNVKSVDVQFPAPKRFDEMGLQVFGYDGDVMYPLTIHPETPGEPMTLALKTDFLVCHELCVPEFLEVSLDIPSGAAVTSKSAAMMDLAKRKIPGENNAGLKIEAAVAGPEALVLNVYAKRGFDRADVFVEAGDLVITATPEITPDENDPRHGQVKIGLPFGESNMQEALAGKDVRVTFTDGQQAVEHVFSL